MNVFKRRTRLAGNFLASSSIILMGSFLVNVVNYLFTLIISRLIGVEAFGEVTALFSLLLIVSVPAAALSMLMTRETAAHQLHSTQRVRELFLFLRSYVFTTSILSWIAFLVSVPFVGYFLQMGYVPLLVFSILIPITLASALQSGALQGLQEFFLLSKQNVASAIVKLTASLVLVYLGFSVTGVIVGLVLAHLTAWYYGYRSTHALVRLSDGAPTASGIFSSSSMRGLFSTILVTTLLLVLLSNIDVLLAKHYLSPLIAGQYGALSTIGKILVYGVGAFITVLLPMVSAAHVQANGAGNRILWLSLGVIALASVGVYIVFALFPHIVVSLLFGGRYVGIEPHLALFSLAMAGMSLATALITYFVAVHNTSFIYLLLGGIIAEVLLIASRHADLAQMTTSLVISSTILLLLMLANYYFFCRAHSTLTL